MSVRQWPQLQVRINPILRERLYQAAKDRVISVTLLVNFALEYYLDALEEKK